MWRRPTSGCVTRCSTASATPSIITPSICTLEFEVHRPLYDWILQNLDLPRPLPHQYEFARLSLGYTVMSKRKLMQLVNEGLVSGWGDARMRLPHRHHQIQRAHRRRRVGEGHPRRPQPAGPPPVGSSAPAEDRDHQ